MAYNGGLEDTQNNWPFSVRYTASPYRKSKFPVVLDSPPPPALPPVSTLPQVPTTSMLENNGSSSNTPLAHWFTNGNSSGNSHHHFHGNGLPPYHPLQYVNTMAGLSQNYRRGYYNNNNDNDVYVDDTRNSAGFSHIQQQQQQSESHHQYSIAGSDRQQQQQLQHQHHHHNHYGLPVGSSDPNFFMRYPLRHLRPNNTCSYLSHHPAHHQVEGGEGSNNILDEGYIEDLKQPYGTKKVNVVVGGSCAAATGDNKSMDYDPYSYVYDSKIQQHHQMDLTVTSGNSSSGLCCGIVGGVGSHSDCTMPIQYGNGNNGGGNHNSFIGNLRSNSGGDSGNGGGGCCDTKSENEYEEIRDVARYMNSTTTTTNGSIHFKSFSSTDDILAEVVQVQRGHDRVLDQLNLEVENLLINSSNDIVQGGGGCGSDNLKEKNLDKMSSLSLNGIYTECYCDVIPSVPQFGGTLNVVRPGGIGSGGPPLNSLSSGSSSKDSCCCCAQEEEEEDEEREGGGEDYNNFDDGGEEGTLRRNLEGPPARSRRSNSLILNGFNTFHHPQQQQHQLAQQQQQQQGLPTTFAPLNKQKPLFTSMDDTCLGGANNGLLCSNNNGTNIAHRKKKLEREPVSDTKLMFNHHHPHHHHHIAPGDKHWKNPHHRSYSLIPHWKIREHLRRLPFLRQQNKLKKTEGSTTTTSGPPPTVPPVIPISASGQDLLLSSSGSNNKKMMNAAATTTMLTTSSSSNNNKSTTTPVVSTKARSSSMDELRATGPEEHWYSADSDTEPDSLTAIQESPAAGGAAVIITNGNNGTSCPISPSSTAAATSSPLGNTISSSIGPKVGGSVGENGSRMDLGSAIPEAPKAPKFRRGTGLKDKWRESWSSSTKTLAKQSQPSSMDEENRLLRWFSLRKNQANVEPTTVGSRHSTLPLLSEEDLKRISYIEDEEGYWPRRTVQPPALPPPPSDLSPEKVTRRHIVAAIVHSENSYVAALQRLVNEYKKPLERSHPAILSHSKISSIFHRVPEILQCHSLFRIALAECVRRWDADEKIGDVFVASFSKSLVLDVYSEFINNFGLAMETAKVEARRKSAFADFLKVKQITAHDRLSLFGLMVKPVQRFPQFILLLQDLLKHTPKDHHDRMSLQLALTQLESLAAMLNERKRESEQYQAFRETIKSIGGGKFVLLRSIADDPNRILLRQDVVTQLEFDNSGAAVAKSKSRKLLLLNDMLICVALSQSNSNNDQQQSSSSGAGNGSTEGGTASGSGSGSNKVEKCVFKWSYPVRDVEVEDISISPTMSRFVHGKSGSFKGNSNSGPNSLPEQAAAAAQDTGTSISLLEEMQSLMHDYEVLSRILTLVSSLKSQYDGLTEGSVKELMLEIQHQIRCRDEQISYFDSSCLTLLVGTGNNRDKVVFQMASPAARNEWIEELRLAQLALDPNNSPSWDIPSESPYPPHKLPLFVRSLTLTKSPNKATVKCGCYFTHTFVSPTGRSKILDYLWVSSTDGMSSHVTAFRAQQNALKEVSSFDLVEEKVNDLLFVAGYVWVATKSRKIMVFDPADPDKGSVSSYLLSDSVLKLTQFEGNIYAGLADGTLAVFTEQNPQLLKPAHLIKIGQDRVRSVFGSRDHVYAACGNAVVSVDIKTHTIERNVVLNHHNGPIAHMACSGVGLWITTQDSGTVCLYHLESLQHLQDVSVAPSVFRTVRDSFRRQEGCYVTCLTAHKGWLWIGTNLGVILTIPLPRLEGVPIISTGKANVSYHGYSGPVSFLMPLTKPTVHSNTSTSHNNNHHYHHHRHSAEAPPPKSSSSPPEESLSAENQKAKLIEETTPPPAVPKNNVEESSVETKKCDSVSNSSNSSSSHSSPVQSTAELKEGELTTTTDGSEQSSSVSLTRTLSDTGSVGDGNSVNCSRTLVVLRKKNTSRDNIFLRNCKTLPRGGPLPSNLRFSIDSDVYGLYGNLINVRGLEDEGRFVDPLYDALRRSDPELVALDSKISTLDRRLKMRMSRPRSLDLSNWSVDSKISASSDESVGAGRNSSSPATEPVSQENSSNSNSDSLPPGDHHTGQQQQSGGTTNTTNKKTLGQRQKNKSSSKGSAERTVMVVVGGRGYTNLRNQCLEHFVTANNCDINSDSSKHFAHLTVWQMKT